ncbi:thioesterase family protein [Brachybacterium aquaticum]|uniref:Acyl-CoA thioesterase n=1 Tax=Brachybacterium aquaticum TaxID=1432564 RepID=A0A841A6R3_9MICO|nr:thioesterase family protein [Brachybacterium aquaticum]MBB5830546.1 acyl-CoA thioesterase [Brachybacterium aquaticum]
MSTSGPTAYFVPVGPDTYAPTTHVGGAWSEDELHVAPVVGLLVHHMDRWRAAHSDADKIIGRISLDILGKLAREDIHLTTRLLRPGRTIELLETTAVIGGRTTLSARAWAMSPVDTSTVAATEAEPMPGPDGLPPRDFTEVWDGGFIRSITGRDAGTHRPGRARTWVTTDHPLLEDETTSNLARFVALIDTANGSAVRHPPEEWMYPNLDLTLHFHRPPTGAWVGLDTSVSFGPTGQGLTSTVLHDQSGPVGSAQQILTVRPLGGQA